MEKRYYTHVIVSYASVEELKNLFDQAKHYCYIVHNRTMDTDEHVHAIVTFQREKSFSWVRKQVISAQNTFTEEIHGDVGDVIDYFQHKDTEKEPYKYDEIIFDDKTYWEKRAGTGDREEDKNDEFVDALCYSNMTIEELSRRYGRDFMKNVDKYLRVRHLILAEKEFYEEIQEKQKREKERKENEQRIQEGLDWLNSVGWQNGF